jgi:hypothetical protein
MNQIHAERGKDRKHGNLTGQEWEMNQLTYRQISILRMLDNDTKLSFDYLNVNLRLHHQMIGKTEFDSEIPLVQAGARSISRLLGAMPIFHMVTNNNTLCDNVQSRAHGKLVSD